MKILVIQQKMIGDVLVSTIICNNLKKAFPKSQIDYLIYPFTQPVTENNPNIDNIILFGNDIRNSKFEFLKFLFQIRKAKYDIVIDAYGKLESCAITLFSGAKKRIGYKQKEKLFAYNIKVDHHNKPMTNAGLAIERRENLFKDLISIPIDNRPKIFVTPQEIESAQAIFASHGIDRNKTVIMVNVFGSDSDKTYPINYMIDLIEFIAKKPNVQLLLNYMPKQTDQIRKIYNRCTDDAKKHINIDVVGTDLRSFIAIMSQCDVLIGNDGGAVNIAKALAKPTFTIFSPWIEKESWSIFEDGKFHVGVHLNDFPELATTLSRQHLKKNYEVYYDKLKPEFLFEKLDSFLTIHAPSYV